MKRAISSTFAEPEKTRATRAAYFCAIAEATLIKVAVTNLLSGQPSHLSVFSGHYVLAVGFDIPKRKIYYRNPTLRDRVCVMSFDRFDEARNSYGTDKDVIFVSAVDD